MTESERGLIVRLFGIRGLMFDKLWRLKSGIWSPYYINLRVLISDADALTMVGRVLGDRVLQITPRPDLIAALPMSGLPIGTSVMMQTKIPMIYPRPAKGYGTNVEIEGAFQPGQRVAEVDDMITDGKTKLEGLRPLVSAGLIVSDAVVLIDRRQGGREALAEEGITLHAAFDAEQIVRELAAVGQISAAVCDRVLVFMADPMKWQKDNAEEIARAQAA